MNFEEEVKAVCSDIAGMLIAKNRAYGNSALDPVRTFSKADAVESLKVRIDDKLSRIARGCSAFEDFEDTLFDLIGYLVLLWMALARPVTESDTLKTPQSSEESDPKRSTEPRRRGEGYL